MNLTAIILLAGCLQVSAGGFSQTVTLSRTDSPLENVFREIKKQTGYSFFYNVKLLEKTTNISIDVTNAPLKDVMEECIKGQPLAFSIVNKTIVITAAPEPAPAQTQSIPDFLDIRGKITDQNTGEPIAGANISVKNSRMVVTSNERGEFVISVDPGAVLVITYVGYTSRELTVKNTAFLTVRLKPASDNTEEMVITGYQKIRKESYTGNEVTVSGEDLKKINPQNVLAAMQTFDPSFRVADNTLFGSDPNKLSAITVRGSTTIPSGAGESLNRNDLLSTYNLPTFILDGYEVNMQKVFDLDINRIQSVTLLKDAAATAVYGSRAANGVLVITTKAPKEGKLQLSYNYELNVMMPDLTDYKLLDARQKLEYEWLAGLYEGTSYNGQSSDELEELYYRKKLAAESGVNTYWLSQPLKTAIGQKHSAYIEGGSGSFRYGLELRHQSTPGVMRGSARDRNSLGMSFSYNPSSKLIFKNELTVTQVKAKESPYGSFAKYATMNPYYPKNDSSGKLLREVDFWMRRKDGKLVQEVVLNPLYDATLHSFDKTGYLELIDAFSGEWNISDAFRLRASGSVTKRKTTGDRFKSPLSNEYYFYRPEDIPKRGSYDYSELDETALDGSLVLTYNKQVADHFFNLAAGSNIRTSILDYKEINAIGFTNDRFTSIGFSNSYKENAHPVSSYNEDRLFGAFLSGNYSYRNKYLMDVSARLDGSSKFGTENKVAPFWALGVGWNIHKEDFFRQSAVSLLKLRASMGLTGAVSFPPYLSKTTYDYYTDSWYSSGVGAGVTNYGNENIKWQRTRNYDIGLDIGLFNDRLTLFPRYYYKLTTDLLADIVLPPSTGFSFYKENLGDMLNQGYEINLKYDMLKGRNYTVSVNANLAHNTNTIKRISNALTEYNKGADNDQTKGENLGVPLLRFKEGQSLNTIYAVRSLGIDPENGKELFINRNDSLTYVWDVRDIVPVADLTPAAEGFFGSYITYRRFMFNLSFYYRFGGKTYNQTLVDRVENADPRYNVDERALNEKWKNPGDLVFYKDIRQLQTSQVSSRFIQKDDVLELRSVYMAYDFDKPVYSRLSMNNLRLAFTMNDVFRVGSLKAERGISYPFARNFTLSLQTSF